MNLDWGILLAVIAVSVAGLAAVVGLWLERDPRRPPKWAWSLSTLILLTTFTMIVTSWWDASEDQRREVEAMDRHDGAMKAADQRQQALKNETGLLKQAADDSKRREERMAEDIARMLVKLDELATKSDDPELKAFVKEEVSSQSRGNEKVVQKVAQRVKDKGGDPDTMLAKHLSSEELTRVARKINFAPPATLKSKMERSKRGKTPATPSAAPSATPSGADRPAVPRGGSRGDDREKDEVETAPAAKAPASDRGSKRPTKKGKPKTKTKTKTGSKR